MIEIHREREGEAERLLVRYWLRLPGLEPGKRPPARWVIREGARAPTR